MVAALFLLYCVACGDPECLGRVISRTWPINLTSACKEHQHFYYDSARRIQEQSLVDSGSGCSTHTWITRREYIQGPDYIDEFVAEVTNPACDCAGTDTCGGGGSTSGHCGSPTNDRALKERHRCGWIR